MIFKVLQIVNCIKREVSEQQNNKISNKEIIIHTATMLQLNCSKVLVVTLNGVQGGVVAFVSVVPSLWSHP